MSKRVLKPVGMFNLPSPLGSKEAEEMANKIIPPIAGPSGSESEQQEEVKRKRVEEQMSLVPEEPKKEATEEPKNLEAPSDKTKKKKNEPNSKGLVNQGYMMDKELIGVLGIYTAFNDLDKSEVIRNSLRQYIPQEFFDMWRKKQEKK